jgi:hypothetical protein
MIFETPAWGAASNLETSSGSDFLQPLRLRPESRSNRSALSGFPAAPITVTPGTIAQNALVQRRAQISALRAQATREARLWTRIVARRQGWQLQEVRPESISPQTARGSSPARSIVTDGTGTGFKDFEFRLAFANIR